MDLKAISLFSDQESIFPESRIKSLGPEKSGIGKSKLSCQSNVFRALIDCSSIVNALMYVYQHLH